MTRAEAKALQQDLSAIALDLSRILKNIFDLSEKVGKEAEARPVELFLDKNQREKRQ